MHLLPLHTEPASSIADTLQVCGWRVAISRSPQISDMTPVALVLDTPYTEPDTLKITSVLVKMHSGLLAIWDRTTGLSDIDQEAARLALTVMTK